MTRLERSAWLITLALAVVLALGACAAPPPAAPDTPAAEEPVDAAGPGRVMLAGAEHPTACEGLPVERCWDMAHDGTAGLRPADPSIALILLRCTRQPCTNDQGEGETILFFVGGGWRHAGGWGYQTPLGGPGPAAPPAPVRPAGEWQLVCLGVPRDWCDEFAVDAYERINEIGGSLTSIVVSCIGRCTPLEGEGQVVAFFADGSSEVTSGWTYMSSGELQPPPP